MLRTANDNSAYEHILHAASVGIGRSRLRRSASLATRIRARAPPGRSRQRRPCTATGGTLVSLPLAVERLQKPEVSRSADGLCGFASAVDDRHLFAGCLRAAYAPAEAGAPELLVPTLHHCDWRRVTEFVCRPFG